jgi:hypothetical protein
LGGKTKHFGVFKKGAPRDPLELFTLLTYSLIIFDKYQLENNWKKIISVEKKALPTKVFCLTLDYPTIHIFE